VREGKIETFFLKPEFFKMPRCELKDIQGGNAKVNSEIILKILSGGGKISQRNIVLVNAAAAFLIKGVVNDLLDGIKKAVEIIDSGAAFKKLQELRNYSLRGVIS
jgi:anthranilate phosphoribosyltransferase